MQHDPITPQEYQKAAADTALPATLTPEYMLLGLCNEAGEAAGKLKKVLRGDKPLAEIKADLGQELGDVAWYLAGACTVLGIELNDVLVSNLCKLHDRKERGVLQGNGDNR